MSTLLVGLCLVFITAKPVLEPAGTLENKSSQYFRRFKMIDHKSVSIFSRTSRTWSCHYRLIRNFWTCLHCKGVQTSRAVLWEICSVFFLLFCFAIFSRIWTYICGGCVLAYGGWKHEDALAFSTRRSVDVYLGMVFPQGVHRPFILLTCTSWDQFHPANYK